MIKYNAKQSFRHICKVTGSVFPNAFLVAAPCAMLAFGLKVLEQQGIFGGPASEMNIVPNGTASSGFNFLVGFVVVFKTSQAYARYWESIHQTYRMSCEWLEAASSVLAFTRCSKKSEQEVTNFKHVIIRLFSMLNAGALQELADDEEMKDGCGFPIIDECGIDLESKNSLADTRHKVTLIHQWIQQLLVDAADIGLMAAPPPFSTRAFQMLAQGVMSFNDAMRIAECPFPFPYTQTTIALLILHWIITPIATVASTDWPHGAAIMTFIPVFVLWSLDGIAIEIQNPFGADANDIDIMELQHGHNEQLLLLLKPSTNIMPGLGDGVEFNFDMLAKSNAEQGHRILSSMAKFNFLSTHIKADLAQHVHNHPAQHQGKVHEILAGTHPIGVGVTVHVTNISAQGDAVMTTTTAQGSEQRYDRDFTPGASSIPGQQGKQIETSRPATFKEPLPPGESKDRSQAAGSSSSSGAKVGDSVGS